MNDPARFVRSDEYSSEFLVGCTARINMYLHHTDIFVLTTCEEAEMYVALSPARFLACC